MTTSSPDQTKPAPWGAALGRDEPEPTRTPAPKSEGTLPQVDQDGALTVDFVGKRGSLFWLALKTGFFTVLTLGFYRFWMKTRMRRWYWSAIRPGGHPMEYVGDPFEKLLGFFIAVVILTFYIGIFNLLLMFVSFSVFNSSWLGYVASFAGVIPIWFYARYRARRYVLGRTRWRGVRFALEPGAWGYAGKALWYWFLTIITAGILWPRMTFLLEKYRTDRTYFGSAKLMQGGRWQMLYRAAVPFVCALVACLLLGAWLYYWEPVLETENLENFEFQSWYFRFVTTGSTGDLTFITPWRLWLIPLSMSALLYGGIHYRWVAKRLMANHKETDGVTFSSGLKAPRVTMIYVFGTFVSYLVLVLGISLLFFLAITMMGFNSLGGSESTLLGALPGWVNYLMLGLLYLGVFLLWGVLHNTFVTFPLMRHMAVTATLPRSIGIAGISQRARDQFAEAEGFAEALDLGAAI